MHRPWALPAKSPAFLFGVFFFLPPHIKTKVMLGVPFKLESGPVRNRGGGEAGTVLGIAGRLDF